ncbi:immunoglobulin-like domain-containing protein, partial [Listeria booriae]
DIIVVKGYDDANTVVAQANVTIDPGVAPTMTADAFTIGTTRFVTGTYTGGVRYVGLKVGDRVYDRVPVATDGTYQYYAKDLITSATVPVTVLGYDAANQVTVQTVVTVR